MEIKEASETMNFRREKWEKSLLVVSLGLFLAITSSLVLLTSLSNFALSYQTRNMILEIVTTETPVFPVTREEILTSVTRNEFSKTSPVISSEKPHSSTSLPTTTNATSTESIEKRNPVSILDDLTSSKQVKYSCIESCASPSIITAQLNMSLSRRNDNFVLLTVSVLTSDKRVAKSKVAFVALKLLYTDRVNEAQYNPTWDLPIPANCNWARNTTWSNCR